MTCLQITDTPAFQGTLQGAFFCLFLIMPAGIDLQETIPNMADINQQATVTTVVNGEQAEDMLKTLQQEAITLRKRINEAFEAGDHKQLKKLEKELKKNQPQTPLPKPTL